MSEATWWRHLRGDPTRFLFDGADPGVEWRALVELLGRGLDSPAVERARAAAREAGPAAGILRQQGAVGLWGSPGVVGHRWGGSLWRFLAVTWLGADPHDPRVERAASALLGVLSPSSGGFAPARDAQRSACLTAAVCAAMMRCGFGRHPRVQEAVAWLASRGGAGWSCPDLRHLVAGECPHAAVWVLKTVVEAGDSDRRRLARLADRAANWLESRGLLMEGAAPPGWRRFGYPCLGQSDLLEALATMARWQQPVSPVLRSALKMILTRQDEGGRWRVERAAPLGEPVGAPSRWLTLQALVAVAAYGDSLEQREEERS
ncbi:MAG: hypothetical protein HRF46_06765 [Acidobacteriota bacterium]